MQKIVKANRLLASDIKKKNNMIRNIPHYLFKIDFIIVLLLCFISFWVTANVDDKDKVLPEYLYTPAANPMIEVSKTLEQAKQNNKLALIVLGAQWCHDSRGLATNFSKPALHQVLNERFVSLFIDVGNYEDRRDITQRFGYPIYFATPTVLVVDPETELLMNEDTLTIWQSAYSVDFEKYMSYFADVGKNEVSTNRIARLNNNKGLKIFTEQQTERLLVAYARLAPLMALEDTGELEDKSEFYALWNEVRDFRSQLQKDLHRLRNQVIETPGVSLDLPSYDNFSWENK
ncbi:thioredoxin family protein [Glaciecola petra]|uniref:Thioredoxin family protein n=1 Tax=Glaciecola petra TaxID=3075602 RepID=A0ABU2ZQD6_9ALTE|nr:thioredoxin family protein [Aestuariibacter sp. P117]MDT0594839.1 thioredoxin family protein [Aestuariibacter sp. P117]